ncbi:hypothetical protein [Agromyces humatus]|uniref:DUF3558 domain-containing protein n=1 Tax=Agromyces humatus TaxID=279573 RepID=A0ABN2KRX7_9MICO|nr:hypothetical protein [Agromyces humatus]
MANLARTLPALVVLGLALTGCTAQSEPVPSPSPAATTPAATTPAAVDAIECDNVLAPDGYAKLAADGLEPIEPRLFDSLAVQLEEAGGTACSWGKPQTDIILTVVQLNVPDADWASWETALADAGYAVDSDSANGTYTGPDPGTGLNTVAVVAGDRITFLTTPAFADLLVPHSI